jgi:hypothetical protein
VEVAAVVVVAVVVEAVVLEVDTALAFGDRCGL